MKNQNNFLLKTIAFVLYIVPNIYQGVYEVRVLEVEKVARAAEGDPTVRTRRYSAASWWNLHMYKQYVCFMDYPATKNYPFACFVFM